MNDQNQNQNSNEVKKKDPLLLDHNYDGIQELDYPLPSWWVATFALCIMFAIPYFIYYQFMGGASLKDEFNVDMKKMEEIKAANAPKRGIFNAENFQAIIASPTEIKKGEEVFINNCVPCHKDKAQGDIGPNLTDNYWIHDKGEPESLLKIISMGVVDNGMPEWQEILSEEEIYHVAAYVKSLKGTKLPGAKAPQGNKVD